MKTDKLYEKIQDVKEKGGLEEPEYVMFYFGVDQEYEYVKTDRDAHDPDKDYDYVQKHRINEDVQFELIGAKVIGNELHLFLSYDGDADGYKNDLRDEDVIEDGKFDKFESMLLSMTDDPMNVFLELPKYQEVVELPEDAKVDVENSSYGYKNLSIYVGSNVIEPSEDWFNDLGEKYWSDEDENRERHHRMGL